MATADKLNKLLDTKAAIKQAIIDKGVEVSDDTVFADYPAKISSIESGGNGDTTTYEHPDFYELRTNGGTNYKGLFYYYNGTSLDLSSFDTSNVTNMSYMFYYCQNLTSLDVSNFDTSNVTDMSGMFNDCRNLTSLDVSSFNTTNVTSMSRMFYNCTNLTSLDLSNFNTSNVTTMSYMFYYCQNLTSLDVSNFNTSNVWTIDNMFNNCTKLTSLDLSNWNVANITRSYDTSSAFRNCTALIDFQAPKNISVAIDFSSCKNLTHDSLMSILNNLITTSTTIKLTLGATNLAKLTDEEKVLITQKGWTVS